MKYSLRVIAALFMEKNYAILKKVLHTLEAVDHV